MTTGTNTPVLSLLIILAVSSSVNCQINCGNELCKKLGKNPYFDIDLVTGKTWRVYYSSWNGSIHCPDLNFKNATPEITERFRHDMYDYLETKPAWDAATLHMEVGTPDHEVLLFADQGPAGRFLGVPNIARNGNLPPAKSGVPLLNFQMKLLRRGRYLLIADCKTGMSTILAQPDRALHKSEILSDVADLNIGIEFFYDKNRDILV